MVPPCCILAVIIGRRVWWSFIFNVVILHALALTRAVVSLFMLWLWFWLFSFPRRCPMTCYASAVNPPSTAPPAATSRSASPPRPSRPPPAVTGTAATASWSSSGNVRQTPCSTQHNFIVCVDLLVWGSHNLLSICSFLWTPRLLSSPVIFSCYPLLLFPLCIFFLSVCLPAHLSALNSASLNLDPSLRRRRPAEPAQPQVLPGGRGGLQGLWC